MAKRRYENKQKRTKEKQMVTVESHDKNQHAVKQTKKDSANQEQPIDHHKNISLDISDDVESLSFDDEEETWSSGSNNAMQSFIPGTEDELDYSPEAYDMFHRAMLDWSCFCFDILPDNLGANRTAFPHTAYVVAGTLIKRQSDNDLNRIYVMKWKNLTQMNLCSDTDSSGYDGENNLKANQSNSLSPDAIMDFRFFTHPGNVNRLRVCPQYPRLISTWSEDGSLYMWDIQEYREKLECPGTIPKSRLTPKYKCNNTQEGFALDFNPRVLGLLASGSREAVVKIHQPVEGGWNVTTTLRFQKKSVEDVSWKRLGNPKILATCSVDHSICVFDLSLRIEAPQIRIPTAHASDVNSIVWSPHDEELLLSGGDDGVIRVWDMRNTSEPITHFTWHKHPITSLDWHPKDCSVIAASSLDNSITIWDMSVEPSEEMDGEKQITLPNDYPEQLMFQHMGQTHISEIKWHSQIPGVLISTAEDGFNIFKPFNF